MVDLSVYIPNSQNSHHCRYFRAIIGLVCAYGLLFALPAHLCGWIVRI